MNYLIIIGSFLVVLGIAVFLIFKNRKFGFCSKKTNLLMKKIDSIKRLSISAKLHKVEYLSTFNENFRSAYAIWSNQEKILFRKCVDEIEKGIISLRNLIKQKNFLGWQALHKSLFQDVEYLEIAILQLNKELDQATRIISIELSMVTKFQESFTTLKKLREQSDIAECAEQHAFYDMENNISKRFEKCDALITSGDFKEAKNVIEKIQDSLIEYAKVNRDIPKLNEISKVVVKSRIEGVKDNLEFLKSKNTSVDTLGVLSDIKFINESRDTLEKDISELNYRKAMRTYAEIMRRIAKIELKIDYENQSLAFLTQHLPIIEKNFTNLHNAFQILEKSVIDWYSQDASANEMKEFNKVKIFFEETKELYSNFYNVIKSDSHSTSYEGLISLMRNVVARINMSLEKIIYLVEIIQTNSSTKENTNDKLKNIASVMIELKTKVSSLTTFEDFKQESLLNINMIRVKIEKIRERLRGQNYTKQQQDQDIHSLENLLTTTYDNIFWNLGLSKLAERTIVYANKYRNEHAEIKNIIITCEQLFYNSKFKDCLDSLIPTLDIIEKNRLTQKL